MSRSTISAYQFHRKFPTPNTARRYMEKKRWGKTPACPSCGAIEPIYKRPVVGYYRCPGCKLDFTIRTGTVMERSHIPLDKWLYTFYLVMTARKGVSSLQLAKEIGVTQKSAWFLLQRVRHACGNGKHFLFGIVEADETYIGGLEANKHEYKKLKMGRGSVGKVAILGLRERRSGRVVGKVLKSTTTEEIQGVIKEHVERLSVLFTDEHKAYKGMEQYAHKSVNHSAKQFVQDMAHTNSIESVWAVLKRGFYGVYHSFSTKHLQRYVDEFTFRLNEGNVKNHTMQRIDALLGRVVGARITYRELTDMV